VKLNTIKLKNMNTATAAAATDANDPFIAELKKLEETARQYQTEVKIRMIKLIFVEQIR
jgi:hypothetical protein